MHLFFGIEVKNLYSSTVSDPRSKTSPHTINVWSLFLLLKPAFHKADFNSLQKECMSETIKYFINLSPKYHQ